MGKNLLSLFLFNFVLLVNLNGFSQTVMRFCVSSFQITGVNDSVLFAGGQASAGYSVSPQSFVGYLPLDYSLLDLSQNEVFFNVFPVPCNDKIFLTANTYNVSEITSIAIHDVSGREIKTFNFTSSSNNCVEVDISEFAGGSYILSILHEGVIVESKKIIIN